MARAILHVDMDAFFASVEQLDFPELRGKRRRRRRGGRGRGRNRQGGDQGGGNFQQGGNPQGNGGNNAPRGALPLPAGPLTGSTDSHAVDDVQDKLPDLAQFLTPATPGDMEYLPEYEDDE